MTIFKYEAIDCYGKSIDGYLEAVSMEMVFSQLKSKSMKVMRIKKALWKSIFSAKKASLLDLSLWTTSVYQLSKVGLSISQVFQIMSEDTVINKVINPDTDNVKHQNLTKNEGNKSLSKDKNKDYMTGSIDKTMEKNGNANQQMQNKKRHINLKIKSTMNQVTLNMLNMLNQGVCLSTAAASYRAIFGDLFVGLMEVSENTGKLTYAFEYMSKHYAFMYNMRRQILSACYYPIILSLIVLPISCFFILYLIPIFAQMITECGGQLPFITSGLCNIAYVVQNHYNAILTFALCFAGLLLLTYSQFRTQIFNLMCKIPLLGTLIHYFYLALFFQVFSQMIKQNMSIVKALQVGQGLLKGNFANDIQDIKERLLLGDTFAQAITNKGFVTDIAARLIAVGEKTAALDEVSLQIGNLYKDKLHDALNKLQESITPIFICLLGLLFLLVVFGGLLPLYNTLSM